MSSNPLQMSYWSEEYWRQFNALAPYIIDIMFAGGQSGLSVLPQGAKLLMNWDVFNKAAMEYMETWRMGTLANIDATTRNRTIEIITKWMQSGESLQMLEMRLTPIFGENRAAQIAITEVTRAFAEGNILAWRSTGVVGGKKWQTAVDERVCPICGPLQGKIVELDGAWSMEGGQVVGGLDVVGLTAPPAHVRCRCYLLPVVDLGLVRKSVREAIRA